MEGRGHGEINRKGWLDLALCQSVASDTKRSKEGPKLTKTCV